MQMNEDGTPLDFLLSVMKSYGEMPALFWNSKEFSYSQFLKLINDWDARLIVDGIGEGSVCGLLGDFSPNTCALMFALMKRKSIFAPFSSDVAIEIKNLMEIAGINFLYKFNKDDSYELSHVGLQSSPDLIENFKKRKKSGLVVFTSGSTGKPKGILHDCDKVIKKFLEKRKGRKTVMFLLMDHFGGFNTFLSNFAYGGTAVCLPDRNPENVAKTIAESGANLLPTTPTFLNLLLAGKFYERYDLSSVELITYGTEMMPDTTLEKVIEIFPNAKLKQTYGMSELGVLRSKSENKDSLWVRIGGSGFETKIVDNILWVRSEANMIGYLNAPQPFDSEGWMCTGDEVEVQGEYVRFKGRKSDIINVGGKKVFPSEVESVLLLADNIKDATVQGMHHPLMGQVVYAKITTLKEEDPKLLTERLRKHCNEKLAKYKVPLRFVVTSENEVHHGVRFKKNRLT